MSVATSLRLPAEFKAQIDEAARKAGMTAALPMTTIHLPPQTRADTKWLDDFLSEQNDPLAGDFYAYLLK